MGDSRALEKRSSESDFDSGVGSHCLRAGWTPLRHTLVAHHTRVSTSMLGLVGIVPASNAAWGGRWDLGVQMSGVCRTGSTRCGIDWSILPESKSDAIASDPAFEPGRR